MKADCCHIPPLDYTVHFQMLIGHSFSLSSASALQSKNCFIQAKIMFHQKVRKDAENGREGERE